jgi:hypothetical protein
VHSLIAHSFEKFAFVFLGVAGVLNVTFLAVPAVQLWITPRCRVLGLLTVASLLGLISTLIAPTIVEDMHPVRLAGYFLWLLGYGLILGSLVSSFVLIRQQRRDGFS